ncbi:MAG TPA: HNH endonuclease family protein [Terrimicrobiaceae bacterium]
MRHILLRLEAAFDHKEKVDLGTATIEHVLPQTLTDEWRAELGNDPDTLHASLVDTLGNLTLTGYNAELGNLPFAEKKAKLHNTHIELTRPILALDRWGEKEISERAETLLKKAEELWTGPTVV